MYYQKSVVIGLISFLMLLCLISGQGDPGGGDPRDPRYRQPGEYVPPGERGYSTYLYKNRRYGQYQPNAYGRNPFTTGQFPGQYPYQPPVLGDVANPYGNAQDIFEYNQVRYFCVHSASKSETDPCFSRPINMIVKLNHEYRRY